MRCFFGVGFLCSLLFLHCGQTEIPQLHIESGAVIYLAQSRSIESTCNDGTKQSPTACARIETYTVHGDHWHQKIIEDHESTAFYKAGWFTPDVGEPGILAIAAAPSYITIWRKEEDVWKANPLLDDAPELNYDRFCDYEIADVTGDGIDDIVTAAHMTCPRC